MNICGAIVLDHDNVLLISDISQIYRISKGFFATVSEVDAAHLQIGQGTSVNGAATGNICWKCSIVEEIIVAATTSFISQIKVYNVVIY